jgi:sulfoxide reductase heme-binding subunit YedZ
MGMSTKPATRSSNPPLGTSGDQRRRLLLHHVPLALASAVVLVLFMTLPPFDANTYPHADIFSGALPQERGEGEPMGHGRDHSGPMDHGGRHTGSMDHGGGHTSSLAPTRDQIRHRSFTRQLTLATGYVALGLLTLTLLIGPANLLLRKRNPVSNYLRRDAGAWTAIGSVVHVIFGLQVHGGGQISDFLDYFVAPDGSPRLNSFGLGNWTGLAALVIVVGLLALSSDFALRKLKARPWKQLQRLNYALFALVTLHAFFYGALLRVTSPFTLLLGLSVIAVFVGQAVGIWLWRRRSSRATAMLA